MTHINIEIKARCNNPEEIREILKSQNADYKGLDSQIDTYFRVSNGRLKLREGNIENDLIYYERENEKGPKQSNIILYKTAQNSQIKEILEKSLGTLAVVDKQREIYFIDNVKFHIDNVRNLGSFVEIEAIDRDGTIGIEKLTEQCNYYMNMFKIEKDDLIDISYSDMMLRNLTK
ncbi:MAG: class IV adenylate cyclase [Candidatus Woesearchaeota archaeon]|nr:class IV adenylate cyclase [Candidatus Woesearchaeota archaeon]